MAVAGILIAREGTGRKIAMARARIKPFKYMSPP
jgi:hypothetical protein